MTTDEDASAAEAFLEKLRARGVTYFYVGAGTDTAPIVEAYAAAEAAGTQHRFPTPIVATHENLAVGMAHGYAMVTGQPQAVMLHVSVGTANAICALMNAARAQIPMLFTAGRTPVFERGRPGARDSEIHWSQELFDQHGMLRELVKWEYELRDAEQLSDVLDRALDLSLSPPCGPVALMLPREVLASTLRQPPIQVRTAIPGPPTPNPRAVAQLADALAAASVPVVVCTASGADPATVPLLAKLADRFAIGVAEARSQYVCFPGRHPLHLGHDMGRVFRHADALLFLESEVPWVPSRSEPGPDTFVAQAAIDPLFARIPIRSHRSDLVLTTACRPLLEALLDALESRITAEAAQMRHERLKTIAAEYRAAVADHRDRDESRGGPISKAYLSRVLFETLPSDGVVVNEYPAVREFMPFDQAGRLFTHPGSAGLGWGLPAALGVKQAAPGKTVVAMVGDGAYLFSNPAACHHAARLHDLPIVTVVFDNGGWDAVEVAALKVYPRSHAARSMDRRGYTPLSRLGPRTEFKCYVEASGGVGIRVERREELAPALGRAYAAARDGTQSLVHVVGR